MARISLFISVNHSHPGLLRTTRMSRFTIIMIFLMF